jgi:hypothetical protein
LHGRQYSNGKRQGSYADKGKEVPVHQFSPDCRTIAGQTWVGVIQSIKVQVFSLVIMPERQEQKKGEPLKDGSPFVNLR